MPQSSNWNTKNVSNFMRELKEKPKSYESNVRFLAARVNIPVREFLHTDPISYGVMLWGRYSIPSRKIENVMGYSDYSAYFLSYYVKELKRRDTLKKRVTFQLPPLPPSPLLEAVEPDSCDLQKLTPEIPL